MPLSEFIAGNRKTRGAPMRFFRPCMVPRHMEDAASDFLKLGARRYLVISISMVAAVVHRGRGRAGRKATCRGGIVFGKGTAVKWLEEGLVGLAGEAGNRRDRSAGTLDALSPIDDVRATAEYRRDASLTLVRRALEACVGAR